MAVPVDEELDALLRQFVCVRLVQMWGVDLSRFQFDGSLTWAIFLQNADGTTYARYGSRSALGKASARDISVAGFKQTLRGALALHDRYRKDPARWGKVLAAKSGLSSPRWRTPEAIPKLAAKKQFATRFGGERGRHGGCIHCHMVPTHELLSLREIEATVPSRKFWPYPMPNEIGLFMDPGEMATVARVTAGSIAGAAGLVAGDRILRLAEQPILSTADIQWVLHQAADEGVLSVQIERDGMRRELSLPLPQGWRSAISDWRFINLGVLRQVLGFNCKPLTANESRMLGLAGRLGLRVQQVDRRLGRDLGLRRAEVIVAVDGRREPMNLGAFTRYVFDHKPPGSMLELTLRRGRGERKIRLKTR